MEALQEHKQFLLVPPQYRLNLRRLLRVRDEDLYCIEVKNVSARELLPLLSPPFRLQTKPTLNT